MIRTQYAGHASYHPVDFIYQRPAGQADWIIIHILTPAEFLINGKWIRYEKDHVIIYPPNTPGAYRACDGVEFGNNWVSFFTSEKFITSGSVPTCIPFPVRHPIIIDHIMHMIAAENCFENEYKEQSMNQLFHLLYNKLSESTAKDISSINSELIKLRFNINNNPSYEWTVPKMADMLNVSTGYLHVMYKKTFGISCMDDVFRSRIELAKDYIAHSNYSVNQIAELCGYQNTEHFCRQFKKLTGTTASEYKNNYLNVSEQTNALL